MMVDRLDLLGYDVRLFDNRADLPVPVVTAVAVRRDGGLGTLCFAAGSSLDPEDAVRAALCEIASYVPGFAGRVQDHLSEVRAMQDNFYLVHELKQHALLYGVPEMAHHADHLLRSGAAPRSMQDLYGGWEAERPRTGDLLDDLHVVVEALRSRGMDVLVADQTSPEEAGAGLRTVATIVPGLVPIDFGWTMQRVLAMRRLRTAPRDAGWRPDEVPESDVVRAPHPFP
jgi:ribosomal protein S12 methylthiotransferase accessory factor